MKLPHYIPESDDLIASRRAEQASSVQTSEWQSWIDTRRKDECPLHLNNVQPYCVRRGVPESYSHLYDADSGSSAEVAR